MVLTGLIIGGGTKTTAKKLDGYDGAVIDVMVPNEPTLSGPSKFPLPKRVFKGSKQILVTVYGSSCEGA